VIVSAGRTQHFKLTPEQLEAAITPRTRLLFINSPSNPTGVAYTPPSSRARRSTAPHPQVITATDDIYEHIFWGKEPFCSLLTAAPDLHERVVTINGVSKVYAMTGWRIGYAAGPRKLIGAMKKVQGQSTSNPASIAQYASLAALTGRPVLRCRDARRSRAARLAGGRAQSAARLPAACRPTAPSMLSRTSAGRSRRWDSVDDDTGFAEYLLRKRALPWSQARPSAGQATCGCRTPVRWTRCDRRWSASAPCCRGDTAKRRTSLGTAPSCFLTRRRGLPENCGLGRARRDRFFPGSSVGRATDC
jgi:aspartate aminotransferase